MSFLRSLLSFVLSFLFVTLLFTAITSYTIGNMLDKESLKSFVNLNIAPNLISQQCNWYCKGEADVEGCVEECVSENLGQTDKTVNEKIDELYGRKIFGVTLNQVSSLLSQTTLFLLLTLLCGLFLLKVSESPLDTFGKIFITTSISLFIAGFSPNFIVGTTITGIPIIEDMFSYLSSGLELQIKIGIVLFILGIILIIIDRYRERK
jgi:hypothetical protein